MALKSMENSETPVWTPPSSPMTTGEFNAIGGFIQAEFGIKMPPAKKVMLQSRLTKRLRAMKMSSYREYKEYLFSPEGMKHEMQFMIDVVTTNKTDFFRERAHFDLLYETLLPNWFQNFCGNQIFRVWSAGCATGEEPYSLAMVLNEFSLLQPAFTFEVTATDISREAVESARKAIYPEAKIDAIPAQFKKKYFMKSKNRQKKQVRIVPELRNKVLFNCLNLLKDGPCPKDNNAIFCRNVIIYFERAVQEQLFYKCCGQLKQNGYLFIGHSETLNGMDLPLRQIRPTVYQKV